MFDLRIGGKKNVTAPFLWEEWEGHKYITDRGSDIFSDTLSIFDEGKIFGQFARIRKLDDRTYEGVRDPLGIQKAFYCRDGEGNFHFSRRYTDLFCWQSKIYSLPAGYKVRLTPEGVTKIRSFVEHSDTKDCLNAKAFEEGAANRDVQEFRKELEDRLNKVFRGIAEKEQDGWTVYIALSGGLDSTIIATKAAAFLASPIACTLDLGKSEDSEKSIKIARHIGIRHRIFPATKEEILDAMEESPYSCQDYRDFNVHCAALNILLARNIRAFAEKDGAKDPDKIIILTGDLMNEYTCDYAGEVIDGKEYYKLPRVGRKQLQQYLIAGLDTSDREISPFESYGLTCIQPYAVLYDLYLALDESILLQGDPKKLVNLFMVDKGIGDFIPKVKLRAQVGSRENMGILGICHNCGWDDRTYMDNLMEKSGFPSGRIPLFVGRYDVEKFSN